MLAGTVLIADGAALLRLHAPDQPPPAPLHVIDEATPITFGNSDVRTAVDRRRATPNSPPTSPNSGNWDMITVNETGAHKGRYLFTVFETGQSGVQRHDLETGDDRHHLADARLQAATSHSTPATGRRGAR